MLHRNPGTARAGEIVHDLKIAKSRVRVPENLDCAAIRVEEEILRHGRIGLHLLCFISAEEAVCSGDAKPFEQRIGRNTVAEINDVIDRRGKAGIGRESQLRVCGRESDGALGEDLHAVMPTIEPD